MINREKGHALLSVVVVMTVLILMLFSIQSVIHHYIYQERSAASALQRSMMSETALLKILREDSVGVSSEIVGSDDRCLLFGREDLYLEKPLGSYKRQLKEECGEGSGRELVGYYSVSDLFGNRRASYAYVLKEMAIPILPRMEIGAIEYFEDVAQITIVDAGDRFHYRFEGSYERGDFLLLQSVTPEGFYLILKGDLWLLPRKGQSPQWLIAGIHQGQLAGHVISDLVNAEGLYLIRVTDLTSIRNVLSGRLLIVIDFYPKLSAAEGFSFGDRKEFFRQEVSAHDYEILWVDEWKIVLKLMHLNTEQLLSVSWNGKTVWGDRYLWFQSNEVVCPLQSEVFEPVAGWILGCQRSAGVIKGQFL